MSLNLKESLDNFFVDKYSEKVQKINNKLYNISDGFCQTKCPQFPIGCCTSDSFAESNQMEENILLKQKKLYNLRKESKKVIYSDKACKYHCSNQGCLIKEFKSPLCLGYICDEFNQFLETKYGRNNIKKLNNLLLFELISESDCRESLNLINVMDKIILEIDNLN